MRKIEAFIFNIDGVIADTMKFHYLANKKIAEELGLNFKKQDNKKFKCISRKEIIQSLVKQANLNFTDKQIEELLEKRNLHYKQLLESLTEQDVLPGIKNLLLNLKERKIKLAATSSSTNAETILKKLKILEFFDYVVGGKTINQEKPRPEILLKVAEYLKVPYENCVVVEDGKAGIQAVLKTEMFSIGIGNDEYMTYADWQLRSFEDFTFSWLQLQFDYKNKKSYIIGIDGGGTYTRAVLCDERGKVLSRTKIKGGAHREKNKNAKQNVQNAIKRVVEVFGLPIEKVSVVVCGIAGINSEKDLDWAKEFTNVKGLKCEVLHVNDAIIAREAALEDGLGIIAIAGTGSIVMGFENENKKIRNYDFDHLAYAGSRYLTIDTIYEILAGNIHKTDQILVNKVLAYWGVSNIEELRDFVLENFTEQDADFTQKLSAMTPFISEEAKKGSILAKRVCHKAMYNLTLGVKMVGNTFTNRIIKVTSIGGVAQDDYLKKIFISLLKSKEKKYIYQDPILTPVYGAVLMGAEKLGLKLEINNIQEI